MYMIMEDRFLNWKFKVKIWLRSNPTTNRSSFWDQLIKNSDRPRNFSLLSYFANSSKGSLKQNLENKYWDGTLSLFLK